MKRAAALALALGLFLTGCAGAPAGSAPSPTPEPAAAATPALTPEPTASPIPCPELALGEPLEAGGAIVTLERAETLGAITSIKKGEGICLNAPEGCKYLVLTGTVKNIGGEEIDADNLIGQVRIDGKYTYTLEKLVIQGLLFKTVLPPLATGRLFLYAEIPAELADSFSECRVVVGYNDGMAEKPEALADCDVARTMALSVGGDEGHAVTLNIFDTRELVLSEKTELDFVSFKFTDLRVMTILRRKYKGELFACSTEKDMMILALEGTIKNTGTDSCRPAFSGTVTVDGYVYPLREWMVQSGSILKPLYEVPIYVFAVIPPELADNYGSVEFRLGFNEDFANNAYTNFEACRYEYVYRWEKDVQ